MKCLCGCNQDIIIKPYHKYRGIPKYIWGHCRRGKTPWNRGIPRTEEDKEKISKSHMGIFPSPETRDKLSKSKRGKPSPKKGSHPEYMRGKNNPNYGKLGKDSPNWKGGEKLARARKHAKRKRFGFIPLNECEVDGWVGHHLDWDYVIYIPEELHKSVCHSVIKNINMDIINDKVYDWFIDYYFRRLL